MFKLLNQFLLTIALISVIGLCVFAAYHIRAWNPVEVTIEELSIIDASVADQLRPITDPEPVSPWERAVRNSAKGIY